MPSDRVSLGQSGPKPLPQHTPQEHPGCKCRDCFGLAEYMLTLTGSTYGLERRTPVQHALPPKPELAPARPPVRGSLADVQPWEPRPARRAA